MKEEKPKCYGCGEVRDEDFYIWFQGNLWHQSCLIETNMLVFIHKDAKSDKETFLKRIIATNKKLQLNIEQKNEKELSKFVNAVLLRNGFTYEEGMTLLK